MLIDYGKGLAGTVQQPAAATDIDLQVSFGTRNIALMLARITRGLMLLTALETRLIGLLGRRQRVRREAPAPSAPPGKRRRASRVPGSPRARPAPGGSRVASGADAHGGGNHRVRPPPADRYGDRRSVATLGSRWSIRSGMS